MLIDVRQVWIIQHRPSGQFLTEDLSFTKLFNRAGRLYDFEEAFVTAKSNFRGDEFVISSFYEVNQ